MEQTYFVKLQSEQKSPESPRSLSSFQTGVADILLFFKKKKTPLVENVMQIVILLLLVFIVYVTKRWNDQ